MSRWCSKPLRASRPSGPPRRFIDSDGITLHHETPMAQEVQDPRIKGLGDQLTPFVHAFYGSILGYSFDPINTPLRVPKIYQDIHALIHIKNLNIKTNTEELSAALQCCKPPIFHMFYGRLTQPLHSQFQLP
jgi:hypothetical protein